LQGRSGGSPATIVAFRASGPLTAADNAAIDRLEHAAGGVSGITAVLDQGASQDGQARKALVATSSSITGKAGTTVVDAIRHDFATVQAPSALSFHLTGPLAQAADASAASSRNGSNIQRFTLLFVIVLLFVVYRSLLAPLVTLAPAVAALLLAGPLIAQAGTAGMPVSPATQQLLTVLLLGAGTDYGLFLVFRVREEIRHGREPRDALVTAMGRVGESITFSAATVIAALCCLLLASFGLYRGLGPSLAIGIAVMLAAALTLLPALLAILGRAVFWPSHPTVGQQTIGLWGRVAERVVHRPVAVLLAGVVVFGALAAGLTGFSTGGFASSTPTTGSDSATGTTVLAAHFPAATTNSETLLLRFATPIWQHPASLTQAQQQLSAASDLRAVTGPLDPNGTPLTATALAGLHARLGPAQALPATPPAGAPSHPSCTRPTERPHSSSAPTGTPCSCPSCPPPDRLEAVRPSTPFPRCVPPSLT
jgi:RND superfamily putative drug exporter